MKKILTLLLGIILFISFIIIILKGNGMINILSVKQIMDQSKKLDADIEEASKLSSIDYSNAVKALEDSNKDLTKYKDEYAELVSTSLEEDVKLANEIEKYDIDFLWTIIGSYSTARELQLGIEVVKSNSITENEYDLNFTVKGEYKNISSFIKDIEDDSELDFKIEDFTLQPTFDEKEKTLDFTYLTSTFSVKSLGLNLDTLR